MTSVSVVIPVKDDEPVFAAVESVLRDAPAGLAFELIIVDNNSTPEFHARLAQLAWPARVICETTRGPAAARNAGVYASSGEVVFFLDADCEAAPGWIEAGLAGLRETRADILQGASRPAAATHAQRVVARKSHGPPQAGDAFTPASETYIDTKNVAVRREVFDRVTFDESLYRFEDHAFGFAAIAVGFRSATWPAMRVIAHAEERFDTVVAKSVVGGWARRKVAQLYPGRSDGATGRGSKPVSSAFRGILRRVLRGRPRLTAVALRPLVPAARGLEGVSPRLPDRVTVAALNALTWYGVAVGMAMFENGMPQPTPGDVLSGRLPRADGNG